MGKCLKISIFNWVNLNVFWDKTDKYNYTITTGIFNFLNVHSIAICIESSLCIPVTSLLNILGQGLFSGQLLNCTNKFSYCKVRSSVKLPEIV